VHFYGGISYRHICKINGHPDTLMATCTPPHDIPGKRIDKFLPHGKSSNLLRDLMSRSVDILSCHPVNEARESRGEVTANMIWLFWGSGEVPELPSFRNLYGLDAAMTSGVDLLRGLAKMAGIDNLDISGVTDGPDNDYTAQVEGAMRALRRNGLVIVHIEAPDEAAHAGLIDDKIGAIERVDREVIGNLLAIGEGNLCLLAMPDHSTPIEVQTHTADPVPFVIWGPGFEATGGGAFSEADAKKTGIFLEHGNVLMEKLLQG